MAQVPDEGVQNARPPVLLGCVSALAFVVAVFGFFAFLIVFLESGADTGKVRLEDAEAYVPGSVEFIGEENLFLVRLADGEYLALADLDAANRARPERRCRVAPMQLTDARLPGILERYGAVMSDDATGSTLVFREECDGALYDVTGLRLDIDGRNLDRYPVSIDSAGRVVVDTAKRQCSQREQLNAFAPTGCE
ncbi:MAG: hypothetical protein IH609_09290 [Dehalococcoidia bacterium]|nr:hypothetical protein [Dehalococcoidia bacterium]